MMKVIESSLYPLTQLYRGQFYKLSLSLCRNDVAPMGAVAARLCVKLRTHCLNGERCAMKSAPFVTSVSLEEQSLIQFKDAVSVIFL